MLAFGFNLHDNVELTPEIITSNGDCDYGCGIFEFRKMPLSGGVP
jgi:hypothetical protein